MDKLSKENQELSVELDRWIDDNTVDGDFICHPDFIYDKLLEMESKLKQAKIDTINEVIEGFGSFNGYNAIDVLDYMLDTKEDLKQ